MSFSNTGDNLDRSWERHQDLSPSRSQSRRGRLIRFVPGVRANDFQLALVNSITTCCIERVKAFAAKSKVRKSSVRRRNDALYLACLIAYLYAQVRGHIQAAIMIDANAVGAALIGSVGHMQPVEALFVIERAVGLDEVTIDPVRAIIGDVEQS